MRNFWIIVLFLDLSLSARADDGSVHTNFILGGTLGDGSFGFKEPWSEAFFGVEYTVLDGKTVQREFSLHLGYSPTDKNFEVADSSRISVHWLESIGTRFFVEVGLHGEENEAETYTKETLRGSLGLVIQLSHVRLGGRFIVPLSDENNLWGASISADTPLSLANKDWHEYRFILRNEILYATFESGGNDFGEPAFKISLATRM